MILLKTLLQKTNIEYKYDGPNPPVRDIAYDSREVLPGTLFVAIKGFRSDGHDHIDEALERGAVAIVAENPVKTGRPLIRVSDSRMALALLSFTLYECADLPFPLLGVTGTNGKTTLTHLLYQLAAAADEKPALIGTLGVKTPFGMQEGVRTTPESRDLAVLFDDFRRYGIGPVFMEVSSHAIALKRVYGLLFDAAIFTNLTQDHLDFHSDMENYFNTKSVLFKQLKHTSPAIINIDDPYGKRLYKECTHGNKITYSVSDNGADVHFKELSVTLQGIRGILHTPKNEISVRANMPGLFNAENIAGTIAAWTSLFPAQIQHLDDFPFQSVSGRMEMIPGTRGTAVIDYAHTPDAMEKVLKTASALEGRRRIISVFGCGGDRDREKRPIMGHIAEKYSDVIILCNDNPRYESPEKIIEEIAVGIKDKDKMSICIDREKAITQAYRLSEPGDLLMLLGKGAENYTEIMGKKLPSNDKEIISKLEKHK